MDVPSYGKGAQGDGGGSGVAKHHAAAQGTSTSATLPQQPPTATYASSNFRQIYSPSSGFQYQPQTSQPTVLPVRSLMAPGFYAPPTGTEPFPPFVNPPHLTYPDPPVLPNSLRHHDHVGHGAGGASSASLAGYHDIPEMPPFTQNQTGGPVGRRTYGTETLRGLRATASTALPNVTSWEAYGLFRKNQVNNPPEPAPVGPAAVQPTDWARVARAFPSGLCILGLGADAASDARPESALGNYNESASDDGGVTVLQAPIGTKPKAATQPLPSTEFSMQIGQSAPRRILEPIGQGRGQKDQTHGQIPIGYQHPSDGQSMPQTSTSYASHHTTDTPYTNTSNIWTPDLASTSDATSPPSSTTASFSSQLVPYQPEAPRVHPKERPPVWEERSHPRSFKTKRMSGELFEEPFEGAFDILGTLNPDCYQLPWGSKVICIKAQRVENVLLSLKNGVWCVPQAVQARILQVFNAKMGDERVLLLFSVPGSKHFCGVAEMQGYEADMFTDFWLNGESFQGAMLVRWQFCKLVPYDSVKYVDAEHNGEGVTQMWNGMVYKEPIDRALMRAYVEAPHMENLLAKPENGYCLHDRNVYRSSQFGQQGNGRRGNQPQRRELPGPVRPFDQPRPGFSQHRSAVQQERVQDEDKTPTPLLYGGHGRYGRLRVEEDGSVQAPPKFDVSKVPTGPRSAPKMQMVSIPAYVYDDGSYTPASPDQVAHSPFAVGPGQASPAVQSPMNMLKPAGSFSSSSSSSQDLHTLAQVPVNGGRIVGATNFTHHLPPKNFHPRHVPLQRGLGRGRIGAAKSSPGVSKPMDASKNSGPGPVQFGRPAVTPSSSQRSKSDDAITSPSVHSVSGSGLRAVAMVHGQHSSERGDTSAHGITHRLQSLNPWSPTKQQNTSQTSLNAAATPVSRTPLQNTFTRASGKTQGASNNGSAQSTGTGTPTTLKATSSRPSSQRSRYGLTAGKSSFDIRTEKWVGDLIGSPTPAKARPAEDDRKEGLRLD